MVLGSAGGTYRVACDGTVLSASLRGKMKEAGETRVLVGDRVTLEVHSDSTAVISGVLDRRSTLRRRMPGKARGARDVAANLDQVIVVGAARQPAWEPPLIDRFLAIAEASSLPAVLVINKCDLVSSANDLSAPYEAAGYTVLRVSAAARLGLDALRECLSHRTSLFTGPTGVGKSSLLNEVQPGLSLRTGAVSPRSHSGRHTTVAAEMYQFGADGYVVDTPGLRDVSLWGLDRADVAAAFPDISRLSVGCRFDDCQHGGEPGCAVALAIDSGNLAPGRLSSFRKLLAEAGEEREY